MRTLQRITDAKHVTAVGTTTVRTLETLYTRHPELVSGSNLTNKHTFKQSQNSVSGSTDILIQPGYNYQRVNSLITNFHLPGTSLLLLVAAFIGSEEELMKLYNHAINENIASTLSATACWFYNYTATCSVNLTVAIPISFAVSCANSSEIDSRSTRE